MKTLYESILDDEDEVMDRMGDDVLRHNIENFLKENYRHTIKYTIRKASTGFVVDVESNIYMENSNAPSLTGGLFKFGKLKGMFNVHHCNNIKNLEGAPRTVGIGVSIINCDNLETLKGGPKKVKGGFFCSGCDKITSLEGAPEEVGYDFNCADCKNIKSLKGLPKKVGKFIYLCFDKLSYEDEQKIKHLNDEKFN